MQTARPRRPGSDAADRSPQADRPELEWNVALELALGYAHSEKSQPPPDGWQDRFRPAGGSMALADYAWAGFLDLGLSAGSAVRLRRGWTIGLPVS